jgi:hypothetical protein
MARDVPVAGNYPAVKVQPSETNSVWHTDQEGNSPIVVVIRTCTIRIMRRTVAVN